MKYLKTAKQFWDTLPIHAKANLSVTVIAGSTLVWLIGDTVGELIVAMS